MYRAKTKKKKHPTHYSGLSFNMQRAWPGLLAVCVGGVAAWAAFLSYAANQERVSSSAMRRVLSELRDSEDVRAILGDAVRPEPMWYLSGSPWVHGTVRLALFASSPSGAPSGQGKPLTILTLAPVRSRCCRGTSISASGSKGTRVRSPETFAHPCPALLTSPDSFTTGRRRHGLFHEHPQSARRAFHNVCVSSPLSTLLSLSLTIYSLSNFVGALIYFEQCASRSLRTTAGLSLCLERHDQWMTRLTPYSFSLQVDAARHPSYRSVLASNLHYSVHSTSNDRL